MKKKIYNFVSTVFFLLIVSSFYQCANHEFEDLHLEEGMSNNAMSNSILLEKDNIDIKLGKTDELINLVHKLGIYEIETSKTSINSLNLAIKATNVIINNRKVLLDGENIQLRKNSNNTYHLVDSERNSELIFDFNKKKSVFKYEGKIYETLDSFSPAQEIMFIKLMIISQQIFESSSQQTEPYEKWKEIERSNMTNATGSCMRYNISFGFTRAEAQYNAEQDRIAFLNAYPTCSQIGDIDVTCAATLGPCVATVTFSCTGSICNEGVVIE